MKGTALPALPILIFSGLKISEFRLIMIFILKAIILRLKAEFPQANIAAVDYDPGASEVNQLNRIKLMLSAAKENT